MLISPSYFYEQEIKDKDSTIIKNKIKNLCKEISHLKYEMENPDYDNQPHMDPSNLVRIKMNREYLYTALKELEKLNIDPPVSKRIIKGIELNKHTGAIKSIKYDIHGFFMSQDIYEVTVEENIVNGKYYHNGNLINEYTRYKEEFLDGINNLYIGEWQKNYSTSKYGIDVMDGQQWDLTIIYSDRKKVTISGDNAWPYNFDELLDTISDGKEYVF